MLFIGYRGRGMGCRNEVCGMITSNHIFVQSLCKLGRKRSKIGVYCKQENYKNIID